MQVIGLVPRLSWFFDRARVDVRVCCSVGTGNWLSNFLVAVSCLSAYGVLGPSEYLCFAFMCAVALVFVIIWVPETKGVSLEQMAEVFNQPTCLRCLGGTDEEKQRLILSAVRDDPPLTPTTQKLRVQTPRTTESIEVRLPLPSNSIQQSPYGFSL